MQHVTSRYIQQGYKSLNVYQKADELVLEIYKITTKFPKSELFGLISQIRRAAISIVANILEGWARKTNKDKIRFYYIARGSLTEVEYYIDLALKLNYLNKNEHDKLDLLRIDVGRLLNGFIKSTK